MLTRAVDVDTVRGVERKKEGVNAQKNADNPNPLKTTERAAARFFL
jgi:hypothetical protein